MKEDCKDWKEYASIVISEVRAKKRQKLNETVSIDVRDEEEQENLDENDDEENQSEQDEEENEDECAAVALRLPIDLRFSLDRMSQYLAHSRKRALR